MQGGLSDGELVSNIDGKIDYVEFPAKSIEELNETREVFEFPGGKRFHFQDPAGNELAAWSE